MTIDRSAAEQQIEALSARLKEAEAACAAKDAFIAAISRELNNPLAPVLLAVEHLRSVLPNADRGRMEAALRLLERATEGFARRTRALLDLADLTAASPNLSLGPLDITARVAQSGSDAAEMARLAGCTLVLAVAPGLAAMANAEALGQVLGHLLANAFRFGAGRPVRLSARQDPSGATVISITDQGPGIAADRTESVFALFEQARAPLEPGLGLGLWVSARLVAAMGGTISVDSTPGQGARFHVSLPPSPSGSVAPEPQNLQTP